MLEEGGFLRASTRVLVLKESKMLVIGLCGALESVHNTQRRFALVAPGHGLDTMDSASPRIRSGDGSSFTHTERVEQRQHD